MRSFTSLSVALLATSGLGLTAQAETLWDQTGFSTGSGGSWNHYDSTPPAFSTVQWFAVADVTVVDGWNIDTITTYHRFFADDFSSTMTQAKLHIFAKTGPLPTAGDDPIASSTVAITTTAGEVSPGVIAHSVVASGLDIDLAAGDYWVGLTPLYEVPMFGDGPVAHLASSVVGDPSGLFVTSVDDSLPGTFIVPSAKDEWVVLEEGATGTDRDIAITIEGTSVPEPGSFALLSLGGLALLRRRRGTKA